MKVLVAGELNTDLVFSGLDSMPCPGREVLATDFSLVLGSSSAICAAGLSRLGTPVSFLGKIGTDPLGSFCISELVRMGVDASLERLNVARPSDRCQRVPEVARLGFGSKEVGEVGPATVRSQTLVEGHQIAVLQRPDCCPDIGANPPEIVTVGKHPC